MTALLRPDETLTLGLNVIVRPGDPAAAAMKCGHHAGPLGVPTVHIPELAHIRLACPDCFPELKPAMFVAPRDWVALTGPCPTCDGSGSLHDKPKYRYGRTCPDCRDGRRIVPLYRAWHDRTDLCSCPGKLVGRGSIEVVPVVEQFAGSVPRCIKPCATDEHGRHYVMLRTKPLVMGENNLALIEVTTMPVPGRDWGVVIDVVELAL